MKRFYYILFFLVFMACDNNDTNDRNPYLQEIGFTYEINLRLPQYGSLSNPANAVYIPNTGRIGIKGIIVFNSGFGNYFAWEASCPNHFPNECSTMIIEGGVTCRCPCDDNLYSLADGSPLSDSSDGEKLHGLLNYNVSVNGDILVVSN